MAVSVCQSIAVSMWLSVTSCGVSVCGCVCVSVALSMCQLVAVSVCQSVAVSVCQSVAVSVCLSVAVSVCLCAVWPAYLTSFLTGKNVPYFPDTLAL